MFGRLTYRLGNLFIRVARRAPATWEMYGIVDNLRTPRAKRKLPSISAAHPRRNKNRASANGSCGVSHRRDGNTSSPIADVFDSRTDARSYRYIRDRVRTGLENASRKKTLEIALSEIWHSPLLKTSYVLKYVE